MAESLGMVCFKIYGSNLQQVMQEVHWGQLSQSGIVFLEKIDIRKKVIITDDSIVRGTVSESVAQNLLKAGAAEVEYLVSYAPIYHPCFSDPEDKPLTAAPYRGKSLEEIGDLVACKLPSIRKVRYNSPVNVVRAIDLPEGNLCTHCISGEDPFDRE